MVRLFAAYFIYANYLMSFVRGTDPVGVKNHSPQKEMGKDTVRFASGMDGKVQWLRFIIIPEYKFYRLARGLALKTTGLKVIAKAWICVQDVQAHLSSSAGQTCHPNGGFFGG
ncbi:MAG: hypothetical protein BWY80_00694 [Firmicutes bacterium ADurb.Bin456]|nr:MAG: hypothetical protein BWY80_00694 [Firmicutes bacterium ADurb.Bin456]